MTSQRDLIFQYYRERPGVAVPHAEVVDWATAEYERLTGNVFRDPDRAIRRLYQEGRLQKLSKGIYSYDPALDNPRERADFSAAQKRIILERDGYACVICGARRSEGIELHVDHVRPLSRGGRATLDNGQTLCSMHNMRKKNLGQTETGKKMFIRLLEAAESDGDDDLAAFVQGRFAHLRPPQYQQPHPLARVGRRPRQRRRG